jgi:hypothetical protein
MDEQLKSTYLSIAFVFPGMLYEEIKEITKEVPFEENITKYVFSQNLYSLQLNKKNKTQFWRQAPDYIKVFVNE